MYKIYEHTSLEKKFKKLPKEILKRYEKWKDIVSLSGLKGLRQIKGFHDERLSGKWLAYRSSRLSKQYRVIYKLDKGQCYVFVVDINPHDYRRK